MSPQVLEIDDIAWLHRFKIPGMAFVNPKVFGRLHISIAWECKGKRCPISCHGICRTTENIKWVGYSFYGRTTLFNYFFKCFQMTCFSLFQLNSPHNIQFLEYSHINVSVCVLTKGL